MLIVVVGLVILLSGVVWALQGLRLLPGTFMHGNPLWIGIGSATAMVGLLVTGYGLYRK
jgi:hypothetical protein